MKYLFHIRGGKRIRGATYGRTPMSFSRCSQLEHRWIYVRNIELWNWIFRVPEAQCILTLSTFFFFPLLPPQPSAIPCNVDVTCHFPNTGKPWRAARRWARNNVRPQWSDRPHAVALSPSLTLLLFALSVLPHQAQSLPRVEKSSLGHKCTKLLATRDRATFFFFSLRASRLHVHSH